MKRKEPESSLVADVRAMFAEVSKEAKRRYAEMDKRQAETARLEAERSVKAAEEYAELRKMIKDMNKHIGGIDENIGCHAEQFFQDTLAKTLTLGGEKYDKIFMNLRGKDETSGVELDILLVNGKSVAIIEAKNRIQRKFVKEITAEKLAKFRHFFPEYRKHKVYLALAGFSFSPATLIEAQKHGVGIIKQAGDSVEVDAGHLRAY